MYRPSKGGQVIECSYDYTTGKLGELEFVSPISYLREFIDTKPKVPKGVMYAAFVTSDALGLYVVNNTYLAFVYPDSIGGHNWTDPTDTILSPCQVKSPKRYLMAIGYRKTVIPTLAAPIAPYKLFYDVQSKQVFDDGIWVPIKEEPVFCEDLYLYKQLLNTPYTFVYKSKKGDICYG